jgi:16S rRNA (guanine1207-N2)-methyltransferase
MIPRPLLWRQNLDNGATKTLFLPFENGDLPIPAPQAGWIFLNADIPPILDHDWRESLSCVQGFRSSFLALQQSGYRVTPGIESNAHAGALILLSKHRELNRRNIFVALERSLPGAPILVSGAKTSGVQAMRKEMSDLVTVEQTLSKNHAQVFWFLRPEHWVSPPLDPHTIVELNGLEFHTAPGMFSYRSVDPGSAMLATHLDGVKGKVADFGAGWGYLSVELLRQCSATNALDLFEADQSSLAAAGRNVQALNPAIPITSHWIDLVQEPVAPQFDWVIMNPPFHSSRSADAGLGQSMILAASRALKPGGRLAMVANKQLPYEDTLQRAFRKFERVDEDRQFKIIKALK